MSECQADRFVRGGVRLRIRKGTPRVVLMDGAGVLLPLLQWRLLLVLAREWPDAVPYERLMAAVWPDGAAEEQQLQYHRKRLEAALGLRRGELVRVVAGYGLQLHGERV